MWPDEGHGDVGPGRCSTGSEVVIINDQLPAAMPHPTSARPYLISNMNLTNSPGSRIGDNYVTVTNVTHSDEVVKGRLLGLELISPAHTRRLRCSVAVCVCWALVVASGLAIWFFYFALFTKSRIDIGLNETWYLRRIDWQAMPPSSSYKMMFLKLPVKIVMIGHSAMGYCTLRPECIKSVRAIQQDHLERYGDIGPNFLVGGEEGLLFEGRGAGVVGTATAGRNTELVSIMFLGNYQYDIPNQSQLDNVATLLRVLVKDKILDENYILYGYCQIKTFTIPPGPNIMRRLPEYPQWRSKNASTCVNGTGDGTTQATTLTERYRRMLSPTLFTNLSSTLNST